MLRSTERIRICLADDHPVFRGGLRTVLSIHDDFAVVGECSRGNDVEAMLEAEHPDILILDLFMPGMDGICVLQQIDFEKYGAKVLVLTASNDEAVHLSVFKLGAAGVVLKNEATNSLDDVIRRIHAGETWVHENVLKKMMEQFSKQRNPATSLTPREYEVIHLLARGLRNRDIASQLFLSEETVKSHLKSIYKKTGVCDRTHLLRFVISEGLVLPDQSKQVHCRCNSGKRRRSE